MASPRKRQRERAATLADVGRAAGVSAMAASAVLNGARTSSRIAEETRQRILKAANELAYRPNIAARALANRRMHTVGVAAVIDSGEINHYFMEVFNGILEAAARHEQNTTVFALHDWDRDRERLRGFCDGRIDGLILLGPIFSGDRPELPAHTPFVSIHANESFPNVINVESDEERGAYEMVRLLVAKGHRRIMHVAGPESLLGAQRRLRGYKRALASARIPYDAKLVISAHLSVQHSRDRMLEWLHQHAGEPLPHAVFCVNDGAAVGCLEALSAAGLRVPDDISVAGFDDSLAARMTIPQLSTVRQPLRAMGQRAVELLLSRVSHHGSPAGKNEKPVVFPVDLVARASISAPPIVARLVPDRR